MRTAELFRLSPAEVQYDFRGEMVTAPVTSGWQAKQTTKTSVTS